MDVQQWVIGTAEGCDIRVVDEYASAHHAVIFRDRSGQHWIRDLGSTNGTYRIRDGLRTKVDAAASLRPGDTVIVGRTSLPWSAQ